MFFSGGIEGSGCLREKGSSFFIEESPILGSENRLPLCLGCLNRDHVPPLSERNLLSIISVDSVVLKALILAGGLATRLRPLSLTRPKILFPLANKPLIDYTLRNLRDNGVDTVIMAVNNLADMIIGYLGRERFGMEILYSFEAEPLGTGGPIKLAEGFLGADPFLVLNGDLLTEIDYDDLIVHHEESGGIATIALTRVEDPSRYGVAALDGSRITEFIEKPAREDAPSNWINAGVYVVEPDVLDMILGGRRVSIEREVFPILSKGNGLYGYKYEGLWMDIGVPGDYLKANGIFLERNNTKLGRKMGGVRFIDPVAVSDSAFMGKGSVIGPYASIGERVQVGSECRVVDSIVFGGAVVHRNSVVEGSVVGENAVVGENVVVNPGSIIADNSQIADSVLIPGGTMVWPNLRVERTPSSSGLKIRS